MKRALPIRSAICVVVAFAAMLVAAPASQAQQQSPMPQAWTPQSLDAPPPGGFKLTPRDALRIAEREPAVRGARAENPRLNGTSRYRSTSSRTLAASR